MANKNILLIEPAYKNKYPPLGLMKIAQYHGPRGKNDNITFIKGQDTRVLDKCWDRIYVTTLFSFEWRKIADAIDFAIEASGGQPNNVFVGGIAASLMHKAFADESQVAPVPFSSDFESANEIQRYLDQFGVGQTYNIFVQGGKDPLRRPFQVEFEARKGFKNSSAQLETFKIPGITEGIDAIGWVLHHDYLGAVPDSAGIKGLRARVGNIQIGTSGTLENIFRDATALYVKIRIVPYEWAKCCDAPVDKITV